MTRGTAHMVAMLALLAWNAAVAQSNAPTVTDGQQKPLPAVQAQPRDDATVTNLAARVAAGTAAAIASAVAAVAIAGSDAPGRNEAPKSSPATITAARSYHPVVRVASPDGLTYTAVQSARREREACGEANQRFLEPVKKDCKDCQVLVARCERELGVFELALLEGKHISLYRVRGPGLHMAIAGPAASAKASCEYVAGEMRRSGLRSAACISPS